MPKIWVFYLMKVCGLCKLPELEDTVQEDIIMALTYTAGYIVRKNERIDDSSFLF